MKPWLAVVRYKTKIEPGVIEVEYDLEDPSELAIIIEQGPGWDCMAWVHLRRSDEDRFPAINMEDISRHSNIREPDNERC